MGPSVSRRHRVLHIITSLNRGGAERMLVRLLTDESRARDIDHVVVALIPDGELSEELRAAGVCVHHLGMRRGRASLPAFVKLVRLLRRARPTLLMSWLYHSDLLAVMAWPLVGRPSLVWNLRGSAALKDVPSRSTRLVMHVLARLSYLPVGIAANSLRAIDVHRALGYRARRWIYLPNGFPVDHWHPGLDDRAAVRAELGIAEHHRAIVSVARADPEKDHGTLLRAARLVLSETAAARLILVGRGTRELELPDDVREQIIPLGERTDVERLLRGCDLAVLSSRTEGLPNAIGEAMATGLPVVSTAVGDAARLIGDAGRTVPPGDPDALAGTIMELLQLEGASFRALGNRARQRITDHFSFDVARSAYEKVWRGQLPAIEPQVDAPA